MGTRLYPLTNNTSLIEALAGVPQGTSKLLEGLKAQQDARTKDTSCCVVLPESEYILGDVLREANEYGFESREILVEMPDGSLVLSQTGQQGCAPEDASYLYWSWIRDQYPECADLENFLMSGWGRVSIPQRWKNHLIRWDSEFIGPMELGEYYSGGTENKGQMRRLLVENNIWLKEEIIQELDGLYWV